MSELMVQAKPFRQVAFPHGVIHLLSEKAERAANDMLGLTPKEMKRDADVLREIAGNPFADIQLDRALLTWRDGTIPNLARACYDSKDFSMIGILGDALEEAGCNEPTILEHTRVEQTHFRGCWMIDMILGKK